MAPFSLGSRMPSDANGNYSLPSGYLAETGQTIQASQHNPPLEDLGSSMSQRLMRSGVAPMTGAFKAADGTEALPGIAFNTIPGTGLYLTSEGRLAISNGGTKVAELTATGLRKATRYIGEVIPYTGTGTEPLTVQPAGQTLLRADYPDLWTHAQATMALGHTFYNNGNGSTTFGIGDCRGRALAGIDRMNGSTAGRITVDIFGDTPTAIGAVGGVQSVSLSGNQNGNHTHVAVVTDFGHGHSTVNGTGSIQAGVALGTGATGITNPAPVGVLPAVTGITVANQSSGLGTPHTNMQPTMLLNVLLFAGA